jgi:hypothetical protein
MPYSDRMRPMLELSVAFPAVILCFLPMKGRLRDNGRRIALWGAFVLPLWAALGGAVCYALGAATWVWLLPSIAVFALLFYRLAELPAWKSISVLLGVCGVYFSIFNLAIVADAHFVSDKTDPWFSPGGVAVWALLGWVLLGALWHPATHFARRLLDDMEMPGTWYVFWIVPAVFIGLNRLFRPKEYSTLYTNHVMRYYPVLILTLLGLMVFICLMFGLIAQGLGANMRLQKENQFLQTQAAQYRALQKSMEETRRARHDLRQHLKVIQNCANGGDLDTLCDYVKKLGESIPPDMARTFCKNYAVDAVLQYYAEKAMESSADMEISVRMGERTIIPEPEFCVLLGNLLENALEACAPNGRRRIRVGVRQAGESMLSITVDNTCLQPPVWEGGKLRSGKHKGFGVGTESVRETAERYNGDARFEWKDGVFFASVMLNP